MKIYKKSKLEFVNGLLVHKKSGTVIAIDPAVVDLANELETRLQKAEFLKFQPEYCAGPDLSKFERKTEYEMPIGFEYNTPISDLKTMQSLLFMEELDEKSKADKCQEALNGFYDLVMFTKEDTVVSLDNQSEVRRFDTPTLGNPLEWTPNTIAVAIAKYHGVEPDEQSV